MSDFTKVNLATDVEDMAPKFGLAPQLESRFGRKALGLEKSGLTRFRVAPNYRIPFGHVHTEQEEVYLVVEGSGRCKIDDEVVELGEWDAVRIPPKAWRGFEGGPEGALLLAFGAPSPDNRDVEMEQQWWRD